MAEPEAPMELLAQTLEQAREHTARRREHAAGERPPGVGDVYVLEAAREHPVEWVLVARSPADPELFLALPADGGLLAGSTDVALPAGAVPGALRLRCRYGVWVECARLAPARWVGGVGEGEVARAWEKWQTMANGTEVGRALEREVDDDPEYQEWLETVVIPARQAVLTAGAVGRKSERPAVEAKSEAKAWGRVYRLAASLALMIGAGLAGAVLWRQHERIETMLAASESAEKKHREEVARLEVERLQLEAERRELVERTAASAEAERIAAREQIGQLDRRLEELKRSLTVVNPMVAFFDPPGTATVRGKEEVKLEPGASHLVLFLAVLEPSSKARYRLELREKGRAEPVWKDDRLRLEEPGEIRAGVPAGLLTVGEYELELAVEDGRAFRLVARYEIEVEK